LAVHVGKAQFQQGKGLGEQGAVVEDGVDHQGAIELGVAAHYQIAALDLRHIDLGWQFAANLRAQLFEPGAVLILTGQLVEVVADVLSCQGAGADQIEQAPADPASPGFLRLLPVELQRLLAEVEQALVAQGRFATQGRAGRQFDFLDPRAWRQRANSGFVLVFFGLVTTIDICTQAQRAVALMLAEVRVQAVVIFVVGLSLAGQRAIAGSMRVSTAAGGVITDSRAAMRAA